MQLQSVLIYLEGEPRVRVIVPAFDPVGDDVVQEAVEMLKSFRDAPTTRWVARVYATHEVTDVEEKTA